MSSNNELLRQLSEMRNEANRLGDKVAINALTRAIECALGGRNADMQSWVERAIASLRRNAEE